MQRRYDLAFLARALSQSMQKPRLHSLSRNNNGSRLALLIQLVLVNEEMKSRSGNDVYSIGTQLRMFHS